MSKGLFGECQRCIPGASHYQLAIPMTLKAVNGNAKHVGASHYQLAIPMTLKAVNGNAKHVCQLVSTLGRTKLRKKGVSAAVPDMPACR